MWVASLSRCRSPPDSVVSPVCPAAPRHISTPGGAVAGGESRNWPSWPTIAPTAPRKGRRGQNVPPALSRGKTRGPAVRVEQSGVRRRVAPSRAADRALADRHHCVAPGHRAMNQRTLARARRGATGEWHAHRAAPGRPRLPEAIAAHAVGGAGGALRHHSQPARRLRAGSPARCSASSSRPRPRATTPSSCRTTGPSTTAIRPSCAARSAPSVRSSPGVWPTVTTSTWMTACA
ncbi:MAG: hypothetical protein QOF83_221 [Solirubrobacteraceae bacterium]|jgi:hypothetical protein|nr:hypothetical protein [Solirubrobacteraceae bacterium]